MSVEVADLLFSINSSEAKTAKADLDAMTSAAVRADTAADNLSSASRKTGAELKKTGDEARKAGTEVKGAGQGFTTLTEQMIKNRGATGLLKEDLDQLRAKYNPLFAATQQYEQALREIAAAEKAGALSAVEARNARNAAAVSMRPLAQDMVQVANNSAYAANAFAQSNDIIMMTLSGQSPMLLAMQQGMALNQLWATMGGSVKMIGSTMLSAFTMVLNPLNLLTLGVIAGGAALVQWAMGMGDAEEKTQSFSEILDEATSSIDRMRELTSSLAYGDLDALKNKYGEVNTELYAMIQAQVELEDRIANGKLRTAMDEIQTTFGATTYQWLSSFTDGAGEAERAFNNLMTNLQSQLGITETQAYSLAMSLSEAFSAKTPEAQVVALSHVRANMTQIVASGHMAAGAADELMGKILGAEDAARQLVKVAPQAGWLAGMIDQTVLLSTELAKALSLKSQLSFGGIGGGIEMGTGFQYGAGYSMSDGTEAYAPYIPKTSGSGGGGGGKSKADEAKEALDQLKESLMTETEAYMEEYTKQQEILKTALEYKLITKAEYNTLEQEMQREHQQKLREINELGLAGDLNSMSSYFGELYSLSGSRFSGLLKLQRTFAASSALINAWKAFNEVLADPYYVGRPWARVAAAGRVLAAGLGAVSAIRSGSSGSSPGSSSSAGSTPSSEGSSSTPQSVILDFSGTDPALMAFAKMLIDPMVAQLQKVSKVGVNISGVQY